MNQTTSAENTQKVRTMIMEKQNKKRVVLYYRGANEKDYEI